MKSLQVGNVPVNGSTPDNITSRTLTQRTVTAGQWRLASSVVQGALQFGVGVLLARLLRPEDFGVMALAYVVVGFASIVSDLGLGPALVQRQPLTSRHVRVVATTSVLLGIGIAGLLFLIAPLAAPLLRHSSVPAVLRALALSFVVGGVGATARALLQRALDFRRLFLIDSVSYIVGYALVAVTMALMGFGVWSLVAGALMQSFLASALAVAMVRHSVLPLLSGVELRQLFGFGIGASLNRLAYFVARNGDNLIIGRWLGTQALGLYARAYTLMALPLSYVENILWHVLFPALAEIRDDTERLGKAYLMAVQLAALVAGPVMSGIVIAAPHLILGVYGKDWAGAILPLQILCAVGLLRAVFPVAGAVTHATGRVYAELVRQALYATLVLAGAVVGASYGLFGATVGVSGAVVFVYLLTSRLTLKIVGRSWREFLFAQVPGVLVGLLVGGVSLALRIGLEWHQVPSIWIFVAIAVTGAATVPLGIYLLPTWARPADLFNLFATLTNRLPVRLQRPVDLVLRGSA